MLRLLFAMFVSIVFVASANAQPTTRPESQPDWEHLAWAIGQVEGAKRRPDNPLQITSINLADLKRIDHTIKDDDVRRNPVKCLRVYVTYYCRADASIEVMAQTWRYGASGRLHGDPEDYGARVRNLYYDKERQGWTLTRSGCR